VTWLSKNVPESLSVGVALIEPILYQRTASRSGGFVATPVLSTPMLWQVQRNGVPPTFRIWAIMSRSSMSSRALLSSATTPPIGKNVGGTFRIMSGEIVGVVDPGLLILRSTSLLKKPASAPMKYPSVEAASSLSTPWAVSMPTPPVISPRNAVIFMGPAPRIELFWMTTQVVLTNEVSLNMLKPMYSAFTSTPSVG